MYYEETIINGILMFRNKPGGAWSQCSIEKMSSRIIELQKNEEKLLAKIGELELKVADLVLEG
ncbi:hypothetical protein A3715_14000 [Oleiphilus sp. HI0009]|nr:hypothetical protein A3715_14000 [Oleiphilus sp. HI0009]